MIECATMYKRQYCLSSYICRAVQRTTLQRSKTSRYCVPVRVSVVGKIEVSGNE